MIMVAVTVLVALASMKSVPFRAGRLDRRSVTPLAPDHTSRPHRITAAVAAGAPTHLRAAFSVESRDARASGPRVAPPPGGACTPDGRPEEGPTAVASQAPR